MPISFVQQASNTGTSTVTVTLGSNTTAGNCLVVCIALGSAGSLASVASVKLGGVADNFSQLKAVGDLTTGAEQLAVWADPNCAGGQTAVAITLNVAAVSLAYVFEFSGVAASSILDQSATFDSAGGTNSTFSVTSGTTTQASEVAVGCVYGFNTTITGPASPWVNEATITSTTRNLQASYNILSSTGTQTYSGSFGAAAFNGQILVTLKAAAAVAAAAAITQAGKGRAAPSRARSSAVSAQPARGLVTQAAARGRAPARKSVSAVVNAALVPARPLAVRSGPPASAARPGRVTVVRSTGAGVIPPPPPVAVPAALAGMLDRRPGYLKKRILFGA